MKDWILAFKIVAYEQRFNLTATILAVSLWFLIAEMVPRSVLDLVVYGLVGWFWLGGIVIPWIEQKLEKLFG